MGSEEWGESALAVEARKTQIPTHLLFSPPPVTVARILEFPLCFCSSSPEETLRGSSSAQFTFSLGFLASQYQGGCEDGVGECPPGPPCRCGLQMQASPCEHCLTPLPWWPCSVARLRTAREQALVVAGLREGAHAPLSAGFQEFAVASPGLAWSTVSGCSAPGMVTCRSEQRALNFLHFK